MSRVCHWLDWLGKPFTVKTSSVQPRVTKANTDPIAALSLWASYFSLRALFPRILTWQNTAWMATLSETSLVATACLMSWQKAIIWDSPPSHCRNLQAVQDPVHSVPAAAHNACPTRPRAASPGSCAPSDLSLPLHFASPLSFAPGEPLEQARSPPSMIGASRDDLQHQKHYLLFSEWKGIIPAQAPALQ